LAEAPQIFGVSGYSGAGTTPSPKNDPQVLRDNLLPYALTNHIHEREVSHQLEQNIYFMPHVASFFRGITLTISTTLKNKHDREQILASYQEFYKNEPLIQIQKESPLVRDIVGQHSL